MGSKENIENNDFKNGENTDLSFKDADNKKHAEAAESKGKTSSTHPRRESSIKSRSVLKQGHLRVKEDGQKVYKKTPSQAIMAATQLGIGFSVGRLSATPERDVLMVDFYFVEKVWFPSAGTNQTPSHKYNEFRFKSYAPVAFRYFRDLFGIQPSDFLLSLASEPIREISNPGASGSLFFVSNDDMFIVKTVQHKEATFLQQLLPGYYMNIHQNPRTLLPKFFGLYCYQSGTSNIRLTVMNNLLPSKYKCHMKFDLKGSTYKRKANKTEREKKSPTWKDLDFKRFFPTGILLDGDTYDAVLKTISRDVRVLESFNIMDYSFLLGIYNIDQAEKEKELNRITNSPDHEGLKERNPDREARRNQFGANMEAIKLDDDDDEFRPLGGVPAKNDKGERLILFMGIIDILQSYRLAKKMEHGWKSLLTDGDTVSVHKPSFYASRFLAFIKSNVFTKCAVQRSNTKRRSMRQSQYVEKDVEKNKSESSYIDPDDTATQDYTAVKLNKVVTIVEPGQSIDYATDNMSTEMESNASSENLLDSSANTMDELSDRSSANTTGTPEISKATSEKGSTTVKSAGIDTVSVISSKQDNSEHSQISDAHLADALSESNSSEVNDTVFDTMDCEEIVDISDIEITTRTDCSTSEITIRTDCSTSEITTRTDSSASEITTRTDCSTGNIVHFNSYSVSVSSSSTKSINHETADDMVAANDSGSVAVEIKENDNRCIESEDKQEGKIEFKGVDETIVSNKDESRDVKENGDLMQPSQMVEESRL